MKITKNENVKLVVFSFYNKHRTRDVKMHLNVKGAPQSFPFGISRRSNREETSHRSSWARLW